MSRQVRSMSDLEIDRLVEAASVANAKLEITGALVVAGPTFFQVIEGPNAAIDALFSKICADARHADVTCLDAQSNREIRLFPFWGMRRVREAPGGTTARINSLIQELPAAGDDRRQPISDEIAILMRSALRAA